MKLKGTLWALAFAFAAVSCSDDLENSGKNNQPEESEQNAYLAVKIATGTKGTSTKAYDGNGENGDDPNLLPEIVGLKEDKVYDINIFLFEKKSDENSETGGLAAVNKGKNQANNAKILGHGYLAGINETPSGGSEPNHDKVLVKIELDEPFSTTSSKDYWVLAVVNYGEELNAANLGELRNQFSDKAWTGGTNGIESYDQFVMSTHKMHGATGNSYVTITPANKQPNTPAITTVYVERLAARVDLKVSDGPMTGSINTDGTFKITRYLPINLWKDKTYMFKQVSKKVTGLEDGLPTEDAIDHSEYQWLADEIWDKDNNEFNYVLSADMKEKTKDNYSSFTDKYKNFFYYNESETNLPEEYDTESGDWGNTEDLVTATHQSGEYTPIFYTCENTMSAPLQINAYSTGLIFESQFTFNSDVKVSGYNKNTGSIEEVNVPTSKTFFVANHNVKVNFDKIKTIAAMAFQGGDATDELMKGFMDNQWPANPDFDKIKSIINLMAEKNGVEKSFKNYLKEAIKSVTAETFETKKSDLTFDQFIAKNSDLDIPETGISDTKIATLYKKYDVSCYREGKSYHKYWIQHDPSAVEKAREDQKLGVMEYGIVRNNVYQLNVTGIRDLGDPLPYTPKKDDPGTPDEEDEKYTIEVTIYVKDWILRKNQDIIL